MHTKNVRMRPVPLWGRCTGSTDFTSRKKNTRKTNGATKQHSMRDQRQLWKSFSSSFASFEFTFDSPLSRKMPRSLRCRALVRLDRSANALSRTLGIPL